MQRIAYQCKDQITIVWLLDKYDIFINNNVLQTDFRFHSGLFSIHHTASTMQIAQMLDKITNVYV